MTTTFLKAKLHMLQLTAAELDYEGSIEIDQDFLDAVGMRAYEKVLVSNRENGSRLETYIIAGPRGSRRVCLNGAAAHLGKAGDRVIVFTFCQLAEEEVAGHKPRVAIFEEGNRIKTILGN